MDSTIRLDREQSISSVGGRGDKVAFTIKTASWNMVRIPPA